MQSTLKLRDSDPHDDFEIAPDAVSVAWADKVIADITREAKTLDVKNPPDVKSPLDLRSPPDFESSAAAPKVDTKFRATVTDDVGAPVEQPSTSRWVKSAVMLVFAICSAAAAAAWQNHGDTAKQMISNWVPAF